MNPQELFCSNMDCPARGQKGKDNIHVHSQKNKRCQCKVCGQTIAVTTEMIFYRLRHASELVIQVITLLAYGCPVPALSKPLDWMNGQFVIGTDAPVYTQQRSQREEVDGSFLHAIKIHLLHSTYNPSQLLSGLLYVFILLILFTLHEYGHAFAAWKLGDDTAEKQGRLTLNPIPHLDLFGSILLPAILLFQQSEFVFGWVRPVPVDPRNFKNPQRDHMLVSFAGPALFLDSCKSSHRHQRLSCFPPCCSSAEETGIHQFRRNAPELLISYC